VRLQVLEQLVVLHEVAGAASIPLQHLESLVAACRSDLRYPSWQHRGLNVNELRPGFVSHCHQNAHVTGAHLSLHDPNCRRSIHMAQLLRGCAYAGPFAAAAAADDDEALPIAEDLHRQTHALLQVRHMRHLARLVACRS
jgi:hypothetical protein